MYIYFSIKTSLMETVLNFIPDTYKLDFLKFCFYILSLLCLKSSGSCTAWMVKD